MWCANRSLYASGTIFLFFSNTTKQTIKLVHSLQSCHFWIFMFYLFSSTVLHTSKLVCSPFTSSKHSVVATFTPSSNHSFLRGLKREHLLPVGFKICNLFCFCQEFVHRNHCRKLQRLLIRVFKCLLSILLCCLCVKFATLEFILALCGSKAVFKGWIVVTLVWDILRQSNCALGNRGSILRHIFLTLNPIVDLENKSSLLITTSELLFFAGIEPGLGELTKSEGTPRMSTVTAFFNKNASTVKSKSEFFWNKLQVRLLCLIYCQFSNYSAL